MKKYYNKIITYSIIVLILGIIYYYQVTRPIKIQSVNIIVYKMHDKMLKPSIDSLKNTYQDIYTGMTYGSDLLRLNGEFPEGEIEDYRDVTIELKVKNRSFFRQYCFKGDLTASDDSRMLYTIGGKMMK